MFLALATLDLQSAFHNNALVMLLSPFALMLGLRRWILYVKSGKHDMDLPEKLLVFPALLLTLAFWVLRNMDRFCWLAPS